MKYKLRKNYSHDPDIALLEILQDRGVEDIESFCIPTPACELNPHDLKNIDAAADLLIKHLNKNSNILCVIDADFDGFSSSAVLWLYIKRLFPDARLNFTIHEHKQHGIDDKINWIVEQDFDLIIIPDAGSYQVKEHQELFDAGMDCIVLDHHMQEYDENGQPIISTTAIVVNNQLSPEYSNKSLCGVGVVYKFCEILDERFDVHYAKDYIDLVAVGEIADVMYKGTSETNYLITTGLKHIKNYGLRTLIESQSFSLKERAVYPYPGLTSIDIAFYIAPLINSITRVGTMEEKTAMFYCFIEPFKALQSTKRGAKNGDIEWAAEQTARVGKNAKARQDKLKKEAIEIIDYKIQKNELDDDDNIPQELSGLIAMAIVNKYNKPCLIGRFNDRNELKGSLRNNNNFAALPDLKQYLETSGYFDFVAGHDNAAGFQIQERKIDAFTKFANNDLPADAFENCYIVDYILDARDDITELVRALASHPEYFGNGIDEIKLVIKNINIKNFVLIGPAKDSIKISYNGIDYVHFKDNDFILDIMENADKLLTVYCRANLNTWGGRTTVQCFIDDYALEEDNHKYDF